MRTTTDRRPQASTREEGSALILAALVTVILSLLGLSYTMMAQTENTIAENERNAAAALYVAEAGVRLVVGWFNDPTSTGYLVPGTSAMDRSKRVLDHDLNPSTARVLAVAGDATKPIYKDAVLTPSPVFDRPYRAALANTFMGVETGTDPNPSHADKGPDVIIGQSHLNTINNALFPNFPSPTLRARVTRIEVYGPPLVSIGGSLERMGIATVKVTAGVFLYPGTAEERQVATRIAKAVVNEIPVPGPVGPLQSCSALAYTGSFEIHWGTGSSMGNANLPSNLDGKVFSGMPFALNDPFTYINGATTLASWATTHNNQTIEDPWSKFIAGGAIDEATNSNPQPWPWNAATPLDTEHSNLFQHTILNCPTFDYGLWKSIAQSGMKNHYYYKWVSGMNYSLDGTGPATDASTILTGRTGVIFMDTQDGLVPNVAGTNLTPEVTLSGTPWGGQGFLYMNTSNFKTTGTAGGGVTRTVIPPGEPGDSSGFVNFDYPSSLSGSFRIRSGVVNFETFQDPVTGDWYCTDASVCTSATRTAAGAPVKDNYGLPFQTNIAFDGVFYNSGTFEIQGNAQYFGSVVAERGVIDGAGNPGFWFDESLIKGNWPRKGMNLPRVVISSWQTDL